MNLKHNTVQSIVKCSMGWMIFFPRIVAKIRPELKLINVDFVLGGQRNRK